jgi:hypothetical protein
MFAGPKIRLCPTQKLSHGTRARAVSHVIRMQHADRPHRDGHAPQRVYLCPKCGGWHATSRPN